MAPLKCWLYINGYGVLVIIVLARVFQRIHTENRSGMTGTAVRYRLSQAS